MTRKERFVQSLKDWKTWVFNIIPLIAIVVLLVLFVASPKDSYNSNYVLCAVIIFYAYAITQFPNELLCLSVKRSVQE